MKIACLILILSAALPAADTLAVLQVSGCKSGLAVYVDDRFVGPTPLQAQFQPGTYHLRVATPYTREWGQNDFQTLVTLNAGEQVDVEAVFPRRLVIQSSPYEAAVFKNEKLLGYTPLTVLVDSDNRDVIRLEKAGYESVSHIVQEIPDNHLFVTLAVTPSWQEEKRAATLRTGLEVKKHRRLMLAGLGLATVTGLATAHFRDRGNEAYDRYMKSAVPAEMDRHFRQSQKNDRIAGATYVLFEVAFVLTGYHFLASLPQ